LVSNVPGMALRTDPNLVNAWGLSASPTGPFWVSDNGTGVATVYNNGVPQSLVVTIPPPTGQPGPSAPTGNVFNGGSGFLVSKGAASGPARFIFVTEDGTISGWNPTVDGTNAILKVDHSAAEAIYKGVALGSVGSNQFLYAAN